MVTITTVGYGDVVPKTQSGKAFTIVFCLVGCTVLAWSLNSLIRYPLVVKSKQSELRVMMQFGGKLSEETLRSIMANDFFDRNGNLRQNDESVNKAEFILMLLSMMNKVNDKDILICSKIFDLLDEKKESKLCTFLSFQNNQLAEVLSAENLMTEIKKAQEREEVLKIEEEMKEKERRLSNVSADNRVRSLKNLANQIRPQLRKAKSDSRR